MAGQVSKCSRLNFRSREAAAENAFSKPGKSGECLLNICSRSGHGDTATRKEDVILAYAKGRGSPGLAIHSPSSPEIMHDIRQNSSNEGTFRT